MAVIAHFSLRNGTECKGRFVTKSLEGEEVRVIFEIDKDSTEHPEHHFDFLKDCVVKARDRGLIRNLTPFAMSNVSLLAFDSKSICDPQKVEKSAKDARESSKEIENFLSRYIPGFSIRENSVELYISI